MRTKSIWCLAAAAAVLSLSACKAEEKKGDNHRSQQFYRGEYSW
ncbi:MAG: hypothetical protein ACLTOJ_05800 [[Clostridium] symbiosum]